MKTILSFIIVKSKKNIVKSLSPFTQSVLKWFGSDPASMVIVTVTRFDLKREKINGENIGKTKTI